MKQTIPDGVWPVMITPYTEADKIDFEGVREIIDWYAGQGVAGIFAVCQSSEMFFLSREERIELARFVVEYAAGRMGVIASGHVGKTPDEQAEDAKAIIDAGVDAYVFISNQFAPREGSEDDAKKAIESLIEKVPADSFGIYECPYPYKRLVSPELLKWCADTGRFTFLKDTCCNIHELRAKLKAVEGSPLKIFNANAATLLESLKAGASGYSGVMANFHASLYVWLCSQYAAKPEMASALQDFLGMASMAECQMYPVNSKYHMQLEGVNINLFSRVQDFTGFTSSRQMEVEQLRRTVEMFKEKIINA